MKATTLITKLQEALRNRRYEDFNVHIYNARREALMFDFSGFSVEDNGVELFVKEEDKEAVYND